MTEHLRTRGLTDRLWMVGEIRSTWINWLIVYQTDRPIDLLVEEYIEIAGRYAHWQVTPCTWADSVEVGDFISAHHDEYMEFNRIDYCPRGAP